jgi:hypothetical protein
MRNLKALIWMSLLSLALPQAAHADWQFTKWGMSREEVIAASGGKARKVKKDSFLTGDADVIGTHIASQMSFNVYYLFDDNTLTRIILRPKNGTCQTTIRQLTIIYGKPYFYNRQPPILSGDPPYEEYYWNDSKKGNAVSFNSGGIGCTLLYKPLIAADGL